MGQVETVILKRFGCLCRVVDGTLYDQGLRTVDFLNVWNEDLAGEVTAPQSQEFLDAVNSAFGTTFEMDQFAGR